MSDLIPVVTPELIEGKVNFKRTEEQKKRDRELIKKLYYFDKLGINRIAEHPELQHISKTQIYNDLEQVKKRFKGDPKYDKEFERKKLVAEAELAGKEAIKSFYLSQGKKLRVIERKKLPKNFDESNAKPEDLYTFEVENQTEEYNPGDPNFLKVFNETIKLRASLMGLNISPKTEINVNGNNQGKPTIIGMVIK